MNPILKKSIETLSLVVNKGLSHPLDESKAKELFKALYKREILLNADEVYSIAIANSWSEHHAKQLSTIAEKIGGGGRVQIKHARNWGEPTVKKIFDELDEKYNS